MFKAYNKQRLKQKPQEIEVMSNRTVIIADATGGTRMNFRYDTDTIIEKCIDGDKNAWSAFVDQYINIIYKSVSVVVAQSNMKSFMHEADDVCQNVFFRLIKDDYKVLRSYNPDKSSFSTWLTVVARNIAIDSIRKKIRENVDSIEDMAEELPAHHNPVRQSIDIPADILTPRQQLVLRMLYDDRFGVEDTAKMLNVERQTVRSLHHRALKRLRNHYRTRSEAIECLGAI